MGEATDNSISQLEQIHIVLVSLLLLLPSMGLKWPCSQALVGWWRKESLVHFLCACTKFPW